jgi:hypothetical protein
LRGDVVRNVDGKLQGDLRSAAYQVFAVVSKNQRLRVVSQFENEGRSTPVRGPRARPALDVAVARTRR